MAKPPYSSRCYLDRAKLTLYWKGTGSYSKIEVLRPFSLADKAEITEMMRCVSVAKLVAHATVENRTKILS